MQNILFPSHDKGSSEVVTYSLSEEEMKSYSHTSSQDIKGTKTFIKSMNKQEYKSKLKPFLNNNYKVEEQVTNLSPLRKIYFATITQLNPPAFDDIVSKLIGSNAPKKKSVKVNLGEELLTHIDAIAKTLKVSRSELVEDLLKESMVQIASRIQNV